MTYSKTKLKRAALNHVLVLDNFEQKKYHTNFYLCGLYDRLCGLVVRVPGYRSRGLGSMPGAKRFSDK
jgi:hypothetical protein